METRKRGFQALISGIIYSDDDTYRQGCVALLSKPCLKTNRGRATHRCVVYTMARRRNYDKSSHVAHQNVKF